MRISLVCTTAIIASALIAPTASADTTFNIEPIMALEAAKRPDPSIEGTLTHLFRDSKFGVSGFWLVTKDWAEIHAGPTYALTSWLRLGVDIGLEQDGRGGVAGRYAVNAWVSKDAFAASGCFEWGNPAYRGEWSGAWYDAAATYTPLTRFTGGMRARRAIGIGPYVQLNVPEAYAKVWLLWAVGDPERPPKMPFSTALTGLTFDF